MWPRVFPNSNILDLTTGWACYSTIPSMLLGPRTGVISQKPGGIPNYDMPANGSCFGFNQGVICTLKASNLSASERDDTKDQPCLQHFKLINGRSVTTNHKPNQLWGDLPGSCAPTGSRWSIDDPCVLFALKGSAWHFSAHHSRALQRHPLGHVGIKKITSISARNLRT